MIEVLNGAGYVAKRADALPLLETSKSEDLVLEEVGVYYSLFEVPLAAAMASLPRSVHPSLPGTVGITFWRCKHGPLGAFDLAAVGIGCRVGIKPRHMMLNSFTNSPTARDFFRSRMGFTCEPAAIHMRESYDRIIGRVTVDDKTLLEVVTGRTQTLPVPGSFVKISPALNPVRFADDIALAQLEASYEFQRVIRGIPQATVFNGESLGNASIKPTFPMSGSFASVKMTVHPVRYLVDAVRPVESGGLHKLGVTRA